VTHELLHVMRGERHLSDVVLPAGPCLQVLPAGRALRQLSGLRPAEAARCLAACRVLPRPVDTVVVDTAPAYANRALAAHEVALVMSPGPDSVMDTYGLIKRCAHTDGTRTFRVILNRVRSPAQAKGICGNMSRVARDHLGVTIDLLGALPDDPALRQPGYAGRLMERGTDGSQCAVLLRKLARQLGAAAGQEAGTGGLSDFMARLVWQRFALPATC